MKTKTKIGIGIAVAVVAILAVVGANTGLFTGAIKIINAPRIPTTVATCTREILYDGSQNFDTVFDNLRRELPTSHCNYRFALNYKINSGSYDYIRNAVRCSASQVSAVSYGSDNDAEKALNCNNNPLRIGVYKRRTGGLVRGSFSFFPQSYSSVMMMGLTSDRMYSVSIERIADGDSSI